MYKSESIAWVDEPKQVHVNDFEEILVRNREICNTETIDQERSKGAISSLHMVTQKPLPSQSLQPLP